MTVCDHNIYVYNDNSLMFTNGFDIVGDYSAQMVENICTLLLYYVYHATLQARSQGGSLGAEEPPSQMKGPQFYHYFV